MKKEEIIEKIMECELKKIIEYESISNIDIINIIKEISGCEVPKMKGGDRVVVFNTTTEHNEWVSALSELGYDVETVEITNMPPAKYRINRRNVNVGYKPEDLAAGDKILWHKDDNIYYKFAVEILTLALKDIYGLEEITSKEFKERANTLKERVHDLREVIEWIPDTGVVITDKEWDIQYILLDNQPVMRYYDCRYNNYAIGLML